MDKEVQSLFDLLEKKNSYLLEFHKINTEEMDRLAEGRADNLETFYYSREILLNAIDKLDKRIQERDDGNEDQSVGAPEKKKLKEILNLKNNMVLSILDQDLTILSLVEKLNQQSIKKHIA